MPGGRFVGEGGFRSQEPDGCEMTLAFRQVRAAWERNTLCPVLCVLYEVDDERCGWDEVCILWVPSRRLYRPGAVGYKLGKISTRVVTWNQVGFRSLDIWNAYPCLHPDPRRNLPTSSRVAVRRVVIQSGPSRVGTKSGDNYSAGRVPGCTSVKPPSAEGIEPSLDG